MGRFVPKEWTGIKGFPPLDFQVKSDFLPIHKIKSRSINPRLYDRAKVEYERLTKYMYKPCVSPWASPLPLSPPKPISLSFGFVVTTDG